MNEWIFRYNQWNASDQYIREALCTLSNGYWSSRGAEEEAIQKGCHYPGTYLAGSYDRLERIIAGEAVGHETIVNWPNWLYLTFTMEDGHWFDIEKVQVQEYRKELDMKRGLLTRHLHFLEPEGRETTLQSVRLVHMQYPHIGALQWTLIPQNWSGRITIRSGLDAQILNKNVDRYRQLNGKHFGVLDSGLHQQGWLYLMTEALQSHRRVVQGLRTDCPSAPTAHRILRQEPNRVMEELVLDVQRHTPVNIEKTVVLYQSGDQAITEPLEAAQHALATAGSFEHLLHSHQDAWSRLWETGDIRIQSRPEDQLMLRLHLFHILQTASPNLSQVDAGLPARGLTGERYQGHVFWDDLFIFPYLTMRMPDIARELLQYRSRRLPRALHRAQQKGLRGCDFPWRSASDGSEQTPRYQWNPRSQQWYTDFTHMQCHQNAAIAYEIWKYYQATADGEFLLSHGGPLILNIARLWSSMAEKEQETGRYHIRHVMGPDEFHTGYPETDGSRCG